MSFLKGFYSDISLDVTTVEPEGVSFDGDTDSISKTGDFTSNIDSKTATLSFFMYKASDNDFYVMDSQSGGSSRRGLRVTMEIDGSGRILGYNSSGAYELDVTFPAGTFVDETYFNFVLSFDLTNSSNRWVRINRELVSATWTTYDNVNLSFSFDEMVIGGNYLASVSTLIKGRLSNFFLDYTFRADTTPNLDLFVTDELKPANWSTLVALNPILALEMKDASTAHINEGTGGNMTQNGTLATADRGANQDNCVASDDFISSKSLDISGGIGASDGKLLTFSFALDGKIDGAIFSSDDGSDRGIQFYGGTTDISLLLYNSAGTIICNITIYEIYLNRNSVVSGSLDMSDTNKTKIIVNGNIITHSTTTFTNDNIDFTKNNWHIGRRTVPSLAYCEGIVGELYFDTNYIDLSTDNPFWNSDTNKPIPVRTAMSNLGSNPLICMPISADNPEVNYGSGGDFTLNGGGLVGARGASEPIARSAQFNASGYLSASGMDDVSTKTLSMAFVFSRDSANTAFEALMILKSVGDVQLVIFQGTDQKMVFKCYDIPNGAGSGFATDGTYGVVLVSIDLLNTNSSVYADGVDRSSLISIETNDFMDLTFSDLFEIGRYDEGANTNDWRGTAGFMYVTDEFIDFSDESNRNLFVNQLGYPRDLQPLIDDATIPNPLILIQNKDPENLGANDGTSGDFTENGTITAGSDFNI